MPNKKSKKTNLPVETVSDTKKVKASKPAKKSAASAQKASKKVVTAESAQLSDELVQRFYQVVGDLRNDEESKVFFLDFLTDSERATFAKRLAIALELQSGKSYDNIRQHFGVSSATISTVAEMMTSPGMQLALKKINNEQWAEDKSKKFMKLFGIK